MGRDVARLLRPGRRRAADASCRSVLRRIGELSARARPARRQRLSRGRRQPPPARPLRRGRRGRVGASRSCSPTRSSTACVDAGGSLTGEHGVGVDKACAMPLMFSRARPRGVRAAAPRVRPRRAREPGQGPADAAPVRRGARAPTACIRWSGSGLSSVSERSVDSVEERRRACGRRRRRASTSGSASDLDSPTASIGCSSTRPATSRAPSRPASASRRCGRRSPPPASDSRSTRPATRRSARCLAGDLSGPLSAPLRRAARPRARRHARARRRDRGERRRQGRQERRRLRPRQARLRLARAARADRAGQSCASIPLPRRRDARRRDRAIRRPSARALRGSQLVAERARRPPSRPGRRALRGRRGGRRGAGRRATRPRRRRARTTTSVWEESRERQAPRAAGSSFAPGRARRAPPRPSARGRRASGRRHRLRAARARGRRRRRPAPLHERCARASTREVLDDRAPDVHQLARRATASTAASACRPARPTSSGARRWTRRAGGSS